jgi:hypothetical protein
MHHISWLLLLASVLISTSCRTPAEKKERELRKTVGTPQWYEERERKQEIKVKDKRQEINPDYTRTTDNKVSTGTGLRIPQSE